MSDPIYQDATMAQVRAVDGTYISYPFLEDGDTQTKVYNMVCTQTAADYNAAQVALDTPMSSAAAAGVIALPFQADSAAYFVGDTGHTPAGGGMISFTRTFANIPQTVTVASGSAFVTFPGLGTTYVPISFSTMSSISMTLGVKGFTITTTADHSLSVGDNVNVVMSYKVGTDNFIHSVVGDFKVLAVPSTTTFRIDVGHYFSEFVTLSLDYGIAREVNLARSPASLNVNTKTRYDYILPGVTPGITESLDIYVPQPFYVLETTTGDITDTVTVAGTQPTYATYRDMIDEGKHIIIESSLSEWAGNILVLKTKTCKAR